MLPGTRAGERPDVVAGADFVTRMTVLSQRAVIDMYRVEQTNAWTADIIDGLETTLAGAGLHSRLEHPPAMCFLDITGYTRLTQERGDAAAADLAEQLGRLVQRTSIRHDGRPVKWLGDGVMFFFKDPGPGVVAALEMVAGVAEAGLPPAHVGLHAGPVIFQEGDFYGQTVNVASRIAEYARPGEVLVSQEVVDASGGAEVAFRDIGPVELKGVSGAVRLHAASRAGRAGRTARCPIGARPDSDTITTRVSLALPRSCYNAHELRTSQAECRGFESRLPLQPLIPSCRAPLTEGLDNSRPVPIRISWVVHATMLGDTLLAE